MFDNRKISIIGCSLFDSEIRQYGINTIEVYRRGFFFWRLLLFLYIVFPVKYVKKFLFKKNWALSCRDSNVIILFDGCTELGGVAEICQAIENNTAPDATLIFYYWNTVAGKPDPYLRDSKRWQIWTFDKNDAMRFQLHFANTFYFPRLLNEIEWDGQVRYDVSFVGIDKGRGEKLRSLEKLFRSHGLTTNFYIVESRLIKRHSLLPYKSVLVICRSSRAILEIQKAGQVGLSLRTCEALFFQKKLITNNPKIKEYCFYHPENILLISDDIDKSLDEFFHDDIVTVEQAQKDYYSFEEWLRRLLKAEEATL